VLLALTVASSAVYVHQATCDDVLAMARPFAQRPGFTNAWVRELVNMLKITVDYTEDTHHDQLVRNVLLQHCFSVINHLGYRGDFKARSPSGKFAMLALGLRNIFLFITIASNANAAFKEKLNPLDDPEVVDAITGSMEWGLSLFSWIIDALFDMLADKEFKAILNDPKRFPELAKYLQTKKRLAKNISRPISMQLILCSSTRGLLLAACRRLMHVEMVSSRASHYYENRIQQQQQQQDPAAAAAARPHPALYQAYQRLASVVSKTLVKVSDFEQMLNGLGSDIHAGYQRFSGLNLAKLKTQHANLTEQQQQLLNERFAKNAQSHCELDMLLGGSPPAFFREALLKLFTTTLPALLDKSDRAEMFFLQHPLLDVDDHPRLIGRKRQVGAYVDVFKRRMILASRPRQGATNGYSATVPTKRKADGEEAKGASSGNDNDEGNGMGHWKMSIQGTWTGIGDSGSPQWRRCVRCGAVMEDLWSGKPGYHFVLTQQRKCPCGGAWSTEPRRRLSRSSSVDS
jgi:mediator of RNA polymerase II transcription subunit 16